MADRKAGTDLHFSDEERRILKDLARSSIEDVLLGRQEEAPDVPKTLKKKMGAFVCLKTKGELKGCIGYLGAYAPLDETVRRMAVEAAFHDPRFMPLDVDEWRHTDIEISVLTPMKKISDVGEIEVGVHGIYIEERLGFGAFASPGGDGERLGQGDLPGAYVPESRTAAQCMAVEGNGYIHLLRGCVLMYAAMRFLICSAGATGD